MPGLIGFTKKQSKEIDAQAVLSDMRNYVKHQDFYKNDALFCKPNLCATRSHINIIQTEPQPVKQSGIYVWLEGEFYNQDELDKTIQVKLLTDPELLLKLYSQNHELLFLKDIDGIYSAVIYDEQNQKVHLLVDRYGLKPLYWTVINGQLIWSSEVKAFLAHPDFNPVIDPEAVSEFFENEHLLGNRTWFDTVELMPPGSILTFDINSENVTIKPYWSWSDIKPLKGNIDEREIVEELGRLFKKAVRKCIVSDKNIGITLSGGLDSRAILAALPQEYSSVHTFTFGQTDCDDIKIAKKVARKKNTNHHIYNLNAQNWLNERIKSTWIVDGQISLLHMHIAQFNPEIKKHVNLILDGFWGDAILGGLYISMLFPNISEVCIANNRGRRFIAMGTVLSESWMVSRRPFADKDIVNLAFSLPKSMRMNSYIYKKILLKNFPEYFKYIPWQNTRLPINASKIGLWQCIKVIKYISNRLSDKCPIPHIFRKYPRGYANYSEWLRKEPAKSFLKEILLNKEALYPQFIDRDTVRDYFTMHMKQNIDYHNELCKALTFELWLQQVYEKKYRNRQDVL